MARQDGYNYFNGAPPVKPHKPRRRWVKWAAGSLVAVALVVWAAVAWYNTFIPGQRLANPIRQEAWHHVLFVFADDATDERLISRSLTQEEIEGFLQALEGASFQRVEQVGYSPWEPYYYLGFTKENGSQGCIVRVYPGGQVDFWYSGENRSHSYAMTEQGRALEEYLQALPPER